MWGVGCGDFSSFALQDPATMLVAQRVWWGTGAGLFLTPSRPTKTLLAQGKAWGWKTTVLADVGY